MSVEILAFLGPDLREKTRFYSMSMLSVRFCYDYEISFDVKFLSSVHLCGLEIKIFFFILPRLEFSFLLPTPLKF